MRKLLSGAVLCWLLPKYYHHIGKILSVPFLICLLSSCALFPTATASKSQQAVPTPITAQHQPYRIVDVCLDVTGSYPSSYLDGAKQLLADSIDKTIMPNSDGMDVYVGWIAQSSWNADALTIHVPSVPPDPLLSVSSTDNIYTNAQKNAQTKQNYPAQLQANHSYWHSIQNQVKSKTDKLRTLTPGTNPDGSTVSPKGTSIYGCIDRASLQLQIAKGEKYLFIASDLEENEYTEVLSHLSLTGVKVRVIFYHCSADYPAPRCEQKTDFWRQKFAKYGTTDVQFFDYQQSMDMQTLFS